MSRLLAAFSLALAVLFGGLPAAAQSIGYSPNTLPLSGSCGVVTVSTPCLNLTQTWNNVATTFTGLKLNVTDTASASDSLLMDLQVGGVSQFKVRKDGVTTADTYRSAGDFWANSNTARLVMGTSGDIILARDAANTLALRNGTAAQAFNIYNTYTDASNYERGYSRWNAGVFEFGMETAGTGTTKHTRINRASGANLYLGDWFNDSSGHFLANTDNTYDIGASGANRPRNLYIAGNYISGGSLYISPSGLLNWGSKGSIAQTSDGAYTFGNNAGTNSVTMTVGASNLATFNGGLTTSGTLTSGAGIVAGAAFRIGWAGVSQVYGGAVNGNIMLSNSGASDFGLLQFGGTTSSFPAIKRNGAMLWLRLADDSGWAALQVGSIDSAGTVTAGGAVVATTYVKTTAKTVATLTPAATAGEGARSFVTDATATTFMSTVAGGGANKVPVVSDGTNWLIG